MKLVEKIKNANFNFVRKGRWFYIAPAVILAVGILMLAIFGFNLGLDFTGGTTVKIKLDAKGRLISFTMDSPSQQKMQGGMSGIEISLGMDAQINESYKFAYK